MEDVLFFMQVLEVVAATVLIVTGMMHMIFSILTGAGQDNLTDFLMSMY